MKKKLIYSTVAVLALGLFLVILASEPYRGPFVITYRSGDGKATVKYIAGHWNFANIGGREGKTFELTRQIFPNYMPDLIILEGIPSIKQLSPQFKKKLRQCWSKNNGDKLITFAVIGGEATDKETLIHVSRYNYSAKDLICFYLTRVIPQWKRNRQVNPSNFENQAQKYISWCIRSFQLDNFSLRPQEYKEWYRQKSGQPFVLQNISASDTASWPYNRFPYFKEMADIVGNLRNQHLASVITQQTPRYKRTLIIYGTGHFSAIHKTLKKAGWPVIQIKSIEFDDNIRASLRRMVGLPIKIGTVEIL